VKLALNSHFSLKQIFKFLQIKEEIVAETTLTVVVAAVLTEIRLVALGDHAAAKALHGSVGSLLSHHPL